MWGPFGDKDSGRTILKFVKDDLFTTLEAIRELTVNVSSAKLNFWESIYRGKLRTHQDEYDKRFKEFLLLYRKWNTPDILFEGVKVEKSDIRKSASMMQDYINSVPAVKPHFDEGFKLLEQVDKILTRQNTASYSRITIILSFAAITISVVAAVVQMLMQETK